MSINKDLQQTNKQAATNTVVLCVHIKKLQKSSYRNRKPRDTYKKGKKMFSAVAKIKNFSSGLAYN